MNKLACLVLGLALLASACSVRTGTPQVPETVSAPSHAAIINLPEDPMQPGIEVPISATQISNTPPVPAPLSDNDVCENPYYPVVDGAEWTYAFSNGTNAVHNISVVGENTFTLTVEGDNGRFTIDGLCTDEGIALMDVPGVGSTYSGDSGSSSLTTDEAEGATLPNDVMVGDDWTQFIRVTGYSGGNVTLSASLETSYKAVGFEEVSVPAGTFYALKINQDSKISLGGSTMDSPGVAWYAQGIGVVKTELDGGITAELTSYKIP